MGEDKPRIIPAGAGIVDANGNPLKIHPLQDVGWINDINTESLFVHAGHWFEVVGISPQGMLCKWKGPTGKTRKGKS